MQFLSGWLEFGTCVFGSVGRNTSLTCLAVRKRYFGCQSTLLMRLRVVIHLELRTCLTITIRHKNQHHQVPSEWRWRPCFTISRDLQQNASVHAMWYVHTMMKVSRVFTSCLLLLFIPSIFTVVTACLISMSIIITWPRNAKLDMAALKNDSEIQVKFNMEIKN